MAVLPGIRRLAERLPTDVLAEHLRDVESRRSSSRAAVDLADTLRAVLADRRQGER